MRTVKVWSALDLAGDGTLEVAVGWRLDQKEVDHKVQLLGQRSGLDLAQF